MKSNVKADLVRELRQIYDNKDFVIGVVSNAGGETAWREMLDFILTAKDRGDYISSDDLLMLSVKMHREETDNRFHIKKSVAML